MSRSPRARQPQRPVDAPRTATSIRAMPAQDRSVDQILSLQQVAGNQAVLRLLPPRPGQIGLGSGEDAGQPLDAAVRRFMEPRIGRARCWTR